MTDCHTLLISDIHLGSKVCRPEKVLRVLRETHFKNLIVNGDLFDSADIEKLTPEHWEVLTLLSDIAKTHPTIMVGGNHGREMDKMVKKMRIRIADNHAFMVNERKFLCLHGDEFDTLVRKLPSTTKIFTQIYYFIQRFGGKKQRVSIALKHATKILLGISRRQKRLALAEGAREHTDVVICSHTHIAHVDTRGDILFVNSGSFCNEPSTYVTIDKSGLVGLKEI
ncbi:MAG: metallophosphoesterase family protein [Candidatus Paceibacterota bacterium]